LEKAKKRGKKEEEKERVVVSKMMDISFTEETIYIM